MKSLLKKLSIVFLLLVMCVTQSSQVEAKDHYRIAGFGAGFAPFNFSDDEGNHIGIDHDLIVAIAKDQGFTVEMIDMPFNSALQALEQDQVHGMMSGMTVTDERQKVYNFSDTYLESSTSFSARADSDYETLDDLTGKSIAVKTGATGSLIAKNLEDEYNFNIIEYEDSTSMYQAVMGGNVDAVVDETAVTQFAISTGQVDLCLVGDPQEPAPMAIAVSKNADPEFLEKLNAGLANLHEDGTYDEIIANYLGEEALEAHGHTDSFAQQFIAYLPHLMGGLKITLFIAVVAIIISVFLGMLIALARLSDHRLLVFLSTAYIDVIRGIPMIVLAFFVYFGIPQYTGVKIPEVLAGLITVTLNATAYIAEIIRGGIQGVDQGQEEAARSLGLPKKMSMRYVVLPQALRLMIPSLINQFIISLKDTSILSVIGIVELTQAGKIIIARTYQSGNVWIMVGLIYLVMITSLSRTSMAIERKLQSGNSH